METSRFVYHTVALETMLDIMGHLNNAAYLTLFENARWELCHNQGFGLDAMQKQGRGFVILEAHVKYLKEVKNRDRLEIRTRFLELDRKVWTIEQSMFRHDQILCAHAKFQAGLFDLSARKLIQPDQTWVQAFAESEAR